MECRSAEEGREAARAGADIVMLDNFQPQVENIERTHPKSFLIFIRLVSTHSATEALHE